MRAPLRVALAGAMALGVLLGTAGEGQIAQAGAPIVRVLHAGKQVRVLAPGASFTVVVNGLGASAGSYCLGLASMLDRYGLPVSLGAFAPGDDGVMMVQATVPSAVFPAEPPGPFLLFAGRCTNVAPDGIFAQTQVIIRPAAG